MSKAVPDHRLLELERRHRELDDVVAQLDRRAYLTPNEQIRIASLKKQKLRAKDAIAQLRR